MGKIFLRFVLSNLTRLIVVFGLMLTLIFPYVLFGDACSAFLLNYKNIINSDFQNAYILNYRIELNGLYAYPDTDIVIYKNYQSNEKIFVSTFMQLENQNYTESYLLSAPNLSENEILLSSQTMKHNGLKVGDRVYVKVPVFNDVIEYTIKGELDCMNYFSNYNLKIGVGIIGYSPAYVSNLDLRYFVQSSDSLSIVLSQHPQALNRYFDRTDLILKGFAGIAPMLIMYCLIFCLTTFIYNKTVLTKINDIIRILAYKGFSLKKLNFIKYLICCLALLIPFFVYTIVLNHVFSVERFAIIIFVLLIFMILLIFAVLTRVKSALRGKEKWH